MSAAGDPPAPAREQRRVRRTKVFLPTELVVDGATIRAHVLDISPSGSLVASGAASQAGTAVNLQLADQGRAATVIWERGGRLGLQFDTCLPPETIAGIVDP